MLQVEKKDKEAKLAEVLKSIIPDAKASIIVFANKKRECDHLASLCRRAGCNAQSIHGDKEQWEREQALAKFTAGVDRVIVATDVAARGLDIKGVTHVINFDFPRSGVEDWVHRVGRTGRAGATGTAISFFDPSEDYKHAYDFAKVLTEGKQVTPKWLEQIASRDRRARAGSGGHGGRGRGGGSFRRGGGSVRGRGRGGSRGGGGGSFHHKY